MKPLIITLALIAVSGMVYLDFLPTETWAREVSHDNAFYCKKWRQTHEPVIGAGYKEMDKLCKSIGV